MGVNEQLLTITNRAAEELRGIMISENKAGSNLRLAAVRTHCMGGRGFTYGLTFEDSPSVEDQVIEHNGIKLCVDQASARYLRGTELDYVETPEGVGFKVNNPNVVARCPCGHHDIFE